MDPYRRYASLMRVLSHPSRLNLLDLLVDRELTIPEIQNWVDLDQAAIHRHLQLLRQAGLIKDRREGRTVLYQAEQGVVKAFFDLLEQLEVTQDPEGALSQQTY